MNRSYRLIWNESTQTYAVAPECTRAGGRRSMGLTLAAAGLLGLSPILGQAADLPRGGTVVQGSGSIAQAGNTLTVSQSSQNLQLNWQQFNIGAGKQVQFLQPGATAVALNRVLGNDPSNIYGSLKANGQVFLINPNGVLFGKSSSVDVGGLVASTLDLKNNATPSEVRLTGNGGTVVNQGSLRAADGGYIALLGQQVTNDGTITARLGTVALGAGNAATLQFAGNRLINVQVDSGQLRTLAANHGLIQADGGTVLMTAATADKVLDAVINNDGVIEARTLNQHGGVIKLMGGFAGGTVQVSGRLDASAPNGGDGGQIETSGAHVKVADGASITTVAPQGRGGTWLLDPTDFTIAPVGGDITGAQLSALVQSNSTTKLSADGAAGSNGDINVNDVVSWSTSNTLTLSATHSVNVNSVIRASGATAGLVMTPGVNGSFNLGGGAHIDLTGAHPTLTIAGQAYTVINNSGGPGTAAQALQNITNSLSQNYALGSDVDLSSIAHFQPIGFNAQMLTAAPFSGVFDGLGHTVQNLKIDGPPPGAGLFWSSTNLLRNIGLVNASVLGTSTIMAGFGPGPVGLLAAKNSGAIVNAYATGKVDGYFDVGGLVGNNSGTITGSHASGSVGLANTADTVGGLVGTNSGTITNSYATAAVKSDDVAGGLVGENMGVISKSYADGPASGQGVMGGLVGVNGTVNAAGSILDAYATGSVSGAAGAGGLVGQNNAGSTIADTYASGPVAGQVHVGGLVGANAGALRNSYWDTQTTGQANAVGASQGGVATNTFGRTTAQLMQQTTYSAPGWDFHNVWWMVNGQTRPFLRSEWGTNITNAHQLQMMSMNLGAHYTLGNDIEMSGPLNEIGGMWSPRGFVPVGSLATPFTGALDGQDHVVDALAIKPRVSSLVAIVPADNVGLFGASSGTVKNIGLTNVDVVGATNVGALVGYNESGGTVVRARSSGSVVGSVSVGGLVGRNAGRVNRADSVATVSGAKSVGGLVGSNSGLVGNAFAAGQVSGSVDVGGLVGWNTGKIAVTYAAATVGGTAVTPGALVGFNSGGTITASYWDTNVTGLMPGIGGSLGGSSNATGHTTSWLSNPLNYPLTWDTQTIWNIPGGQLPQLR